jgi:hypothetical protein
MGIARKVRIGLAVVGIAVFAAGDFAIAATAEDAPVEAVWKPQQATFSFVSSTIHYSCRALEERLRRVLVILGAHERMYVDRRECSPETGMRLHITFMSPIEATDANVRQLTTFDSEDALVARLHGVPLPTPEDLVRFPAEWQTVSVTRDRRVRLDSTDCELVEQIRRQLLPRLATREQPKRIICSPGIGLTMRAPPLVVSTLIASAR